MATNRVVKTSGHMWWNTTHCRWDSPTQSDEAVEMFPGLAGSHPVTTHVMERDALSQETPVATKQVVETSKGREKGSECGDTPTSNDATIVATHCHLGFGLSETVRRGCGDVPRTGRQPSSHNPCCGTQRIVVVQSVQT